MKFLFTLSLSLILGLLYSQTDSMSVDTLPPYHGHRHLGVGFNYTSPAPGLSAKFPLWKNELIQISYSQKSYSWDYYGMVGWGYSWLFYSAEYQHRFEEKLLGNKVHYIPFVYAGGGFGQTKWNGDYFWYFGGTWEKTQDWFGYNLGGGVELFPPIFKNNLGITAKLGFGSYATANMYGYSSNGGHLLFGGSAHYYFL
jgi:hypothetical protein